MVVRLCGAIAFVVAAAVAYRATHWPRDATIAPDPAATRAATVEAPPTATVAASSADNARLEARLRNEEAIMASARAAAARPPPSNAQQASTAQVDIAAATASAPAAPQPAAARPEDVHVVVYTTSWCSVCKQAKAWMAANGVRYEERNIEVSLENARKMHVLNPRGSIPTFDVEGDVMVGFDDRRLVAMIQRAAERDARSHM
jgi:glutaredoxin